MSVLSNTTGTIYKKVNEYYNCGMSIDDTSLHHKIRKFFESEYPIEDMPTCADLYTNIMNSIELTSGFRTKFIRSNIDFIEVYNILNSEIGYFFIIPRDEHS